jgi:hypothetical protein
LTCGAGVEWRSAGTIIWEIKNDYIESRTIEISNTE